MDRPRTGRKVEGVIHWVSANHSVPAEVRLYDRLFRVADPMSAGDDFAKHLNPGSLETLTSCRVESSLCRCSTGKQIPVRKARLFLR